ncbi:MAG: hypothetical protein AMJ46_04895 [Latescibacteria bacterium DG_63]|nr:MAG: hypothetical protein AMJ46_04895 [Latescibacteria bacterium DG_63]
MVLPARSWLWLAVLVCTFFTARCPAVFAGSVPCQSGELTLSDPLIGDPTSPPPILLVQKVIREAKPATPEEKETGASEKSPGKAFVFSMLAPGSGQLYVGAKRGYIYLGVEAIAWTSSYFLWKSGKQKKDEYEDFADGYWTFPDTLDPCYNPEANDRLWEFYLHDKEHYYEDIGKYAYYICGWESPEHLETYRDMRDDSNRLLKGSNYAIMAAVVNHVVSAIDALRLARNYNMQLGSGVKLDLKFKGSPGSPGVMLVASRKF